MQIDCRNLECPQPVLETKKALESLPEDAVLEVVVNSVASRENVLRFAKNSGCETREDSKGDTTTITIIKGYACAVVPETNKSDGFSNKTLFLKDDKVGEGELGSMLMVGFLKSVLEQDVLPKRIICVNRAVLLATGDEDSPSVQTLKALVDKGVELYSCGVCLEFYKVQDSLKVGMIGNAFGTVEMLLKSEDVISL
jgi:selenium metabolism protein YedF